MTMSTLVAIYILRPYTLYTVSQKKLDPFSFEHNFGKYCPTWIFFSQLQTETNC